jgi:UDP-N-acetylglucosamine--N-acetylmuramyl-(pentapeptide) pyrophosphoryl-undecaprenol N-acetylglucosamine transferase
VETVANLKASGAIEEDIIIQTGVGGYAPQAPGIQVVETLPFDRVQEILRDADIVVCHGGTGSLITALRQGCRVIAMPRLMEKGEHYDNHQAEITEAFAARDLIEVAHNAKDLSTSLASARTKTPRLATTDPQALTLHLAERLSRLELKTPNRDH